MGGAEKDTKQGDKKKTDMEESSVQQLLEVADDTQVHQVTHI